MPAYEFVALNKRGKEQSGVQEADTARQARQQLRELGLSPTRIKEARRSDSDKSGKSTSFSFQRGISAADLALITRQFATLVRAALPLDEVLQTVARQHDKQRIKGMLLVVRSKVVEGHPLAEALAEFPKVFPDIYRTSVSAGEETGHLDIILERLADYTENRQKMRQSIQMALLYPMILTIMAIVVTTALLVYVVPEVIRVFDSIDQELPGLTLGLIALSDFLRANGEIILIALVVATFSFRKGLTYPSFRSMIQQQLHHLPLVSRLFTGSNSARFTRTFSMMVGSGVPVLEALRISSGVITSIPMRIAVEGAMHKVREGGNIAQALEQSGYFPPMMIHLIASGEASGKLDDMLERAAENQEGELKGIIAMLLGMFEPLLLVTMGGVVMVIVLAILLPIFEINQLVQ